MNEDSLRRWLSDPACYPTLKACAATVRRRARALGLSRSVFPFEEEAELANALWDFLSTLAGNQAQRLALSAAEGNMSILGFEVAQAFIGRLLDKQRTGSHSAWHAYYRHARQVLSRSTELRYSAKESSSFYALPGEKELSVEQWGEKDYSRWEPPPAEIDNPNKGKAIIRLAQYFYRLVRSMSGKDQWVPVKELVSYVFAHFPELKQGGVAGERSDTESEQGFREPTDEHAMPQEQIITLVEVESIARAFAERLDKKARKIFYLHYGQKESEKELSRKLGYKGESGISYQLSKIKKSLREFCMLWPGLSPEDLNETVFDTFISKLLEFCSFEA